MSLARPGLTVAVLGVAQTLAWASTYYLPAILGAPMARELGVGLPAVYAAFSLALVASALVAPLSGRAIDRWGGRPVLMITSLVFASGLALLSQARSTAGLYAAWLLIGAGMGAGLYEAAFAALVRLHGQQARSSITGITLIAGFASTVGWPLSTWLDAEWGWRGACLAWAGLHLVLGLPLNGALPRAPAVLTPQADAEAAAPVASPESTAVSTTPPAPTARPGLVAACLAFVFAVAWFTSTAMASHLPVLLQAQGLAPSAAVALGALVGPAQVAGRLLEFGFLRRVHPLLSARMATLTHPLGAVALLLAGPVAAPLFALLHGAGNGILTIAKGTLPLVLFGPQGYGARQGLLMLPARVAQALAPVAFGLCIELWGGRALWLSALGGLVAFLALLFLPLAASTSTLSDSSHSTRPTT